MKVIIDTPDGPDFRRHIKNRFDAFLNTVDKRLVERFKYLGEMCVKHAREIPALQGFADQTGNLRSSIGYVVFKDGKVLHEGYEVVKQGSEGARKGKELAQKAARKHPKGLLLVVTAGMDYALAVESRGKDVLTSAEQLAAKELPRMLEQLKININQALR